MKMPSKAILNLISGVFITLLTAVLFFYYTTWRMKNTIGTGEFKQQYISVVEQLNEAMDSAQKKVEPIDKTTPLLAYSQTSTSGNASSNNGSLGIVLQGIFWSEHTPLAMLNDRIYQVGEQIGGLTLKEIKPNLIRLEDGTGNTREMKVMEASR
jgi:hypothetical protein